MKFSQILIEKNIRKADFIKQSGIGKTTLTYYLNGKRDIKGANENTIYKMAGILDISPTELINSINEEVAEKEISKPIAPFIIKTSNEKNVSAELNKLSEHILQPKFNERLIAQYKYDLRNKDRQGVYAYTQRLLSYNSSRIEGNTLTPDETAELFSTGTIEKDGLIYKPKDVEEMTGHFSMFNRCLATLDRPLSVNLIKEFHFALENGVFEFIANGGVPGEFKKKRNVISDINTVSPEDVPDALDSLLKQYKSSDKNIESLAKLHAAYEIIHPFQDGNGRTGRMIIFREALVNGIDPFIIEDDNKDTYYNAIHRAQSESKYDTLINFFKDEQKTFLLNTIPYLLSPDEYVDYFDKS